MLAASAPFMAPAPSLSLSADICLVAARLRVTPRLHGDALSEDLQLAETCGFSQHPVALAKALKRRRIRQNGYFLLSLYVHRVCQIIEKLLISSAGSNFCHLLLRERIELDSFKFFTLLSSN